MIYGNKLMILLIILSFFLIVGCSQNKDFHVDLYDGYIIKSIDGKIKLYKNNELVDINNIDYQIVEYKYNSDVVCLKLTNNDYYMIYYFDSSIYGPYNKDSLKETTNSLSMTFDHGFQNILKDDNLIYE